MTEKRQFRAIKGTRDILPPDSALWNWFEHTARNIFESYNFREIRLPIFEETDLFARSIGADTDVVGKEMYTFQDRPGDLPEEHKGFIVPEYVRRVLDNFDRREIPHTDANQVLMLELREKLKRFEQVDKSLKSAKGAELLALFGEYENLYSELAHSVFGRVILGDLITLRPEATAGVARAYIQHGMHALPGNQKLYYIGPMFRRERPQKGRYRQFYQIGAEVLGQSDSPAIDAEVLEMLVVLFRRIGLTQTTLYVNSIGCKDCRPKYVELLREALRKPEVMAKLGADSQRRIEANPLRVLDSKIPDEQPVIETLPRISDHLCSVCREHFAKLKDELALRDISWQENWRLVRGLDYYTRTTFEVTAAGLGSQNAVCGGGRYDGLVELLGGQPTKGIGFAIGSDRAILSLQESQNGPKLPGLAVFVAWMSAATYTTAVRIARKLRESGLTVEIPPEEMKFKKSLGLADKLGARYALIVGEDEVASGIFTLKRLADARQEKLEEGDLIEYLESESRGTGA